MVGFNPLDMSVVLKDFNGMPYMNDFVDVNVLFGKNGFPAIYPIGNGPTFVTSFGTGPGLPGLIYPEIYLPADHQLLIDVRSAIPIGGPVDLLDSLVNFIGAKVYRGRE